MVSTSYSTTYCARMTASGRLQKREELRIEELGSKEIIVGCLNPPTISALLPQTHLQRHLLAGGPFLEGRACIYMQDAGLGDQRRDLDSRRSFHVVMS